MRRTKAYVGILVIMFLSQAMDYAIAAVNPRSAYTYIAKIVSFSERLGLNLSEASSQWGSGNEGSSASIRFGDVWVAIDADSQGSITKITVPIYKEKGKMEVGVVVLSLLYDINWFEETLAEQGDSLSALFEYAGERYIGFVDSDNTHEEEQYVFSKENIRGIQDVLVISLK